MEGGFRSDDKRSFLFGLRVELRVGSLRKALTTKARGSSDTKPQRRRRREKFITASKASLGADPQLRSAIASYSAPEAAGASTHSV